MVHWQTMTGIIFDLLSFQLKKSSYIEQFCVLTAVDFRIIWFLWVDSLAVWHHDFIFPWQFDFLAVWLHDIIFPWQFDFLAVWLHDIIFQWWFNFRIVWFLGSFTTVSFQDCLIALGSVIFLFPWQLHIKIVWFFDSLISWQLALWHFLSTTVSL